MTSCKVKGRSAYYVIGNRVHGRGPIKKVTGYYNKGTLKEIKGDIAVVTFGSHTVKVYTKDIEWNESKE